jgi:lipoprotein-anchoring transpeptidase ErfK/SrfK
VGNRGRGTVVSAIAITVAALALGACSAKKASNAAPVPSQPSTSVQPTTPQSSAPVIPAAALVISPAPGSKNVSPSAPVSVAVSGGSLASVVVRNAAGGIVKGSLTADRAAWTSAEDLGYGKTYTLDAAATNSAGLKTEKQAKFSTVAPANYTMAYINTAAGQDIPAGVTYGVGQVVKIHFDEPITDKKAAQAALTVTTSPAQTGAFNWFSDQDVYWRTKSYLKPGTKVTISTKIYGKNLGGGLYGQADSSTWFKVGASHISIADDNTKLVKVYTNGKLVKTMPTSMGRHTSVQGDTGPIDLRTNSGPHVVIDSETNINMTSASFGLSKGANAYKTVVPIGVKISYDGEYVHWADWSVWAQGNTDTSHGCLNVSPADSYWFAAYSVPGDIVDVKNTGRDLALWNSGYWNESWAKWAAGSAQV